MKLTTFVLLTSLIIPPLARAGYQDTVLADHPVGYWRLGEAQGSTVAGNLGSLGTTADGTALNGVTFEAGGAINGDADTAALFDSGLRTKVEIPYASDLNSKAFTIEAWAMVNGSSGGYRSPLASRDDSPQKGYIIYATPGNTWEFWTGSGVQVGWDTLGGGAVVSDTYAHLVAIYDGTNKLFYVNGALVGIKPSVVVTPNGKRPLRIGASATESPIGDFFFAGQIDEVAVYSSVLSADRVLAHYQAGTGSDPSPDLPPAIASQPQSVSAFKGEPVSVVVWATGTLPLTYKWTKDGNPVPDASGPVLSFASASPSQSGSYILEISNGAGTFSSDPIQLDISDISKPNITSQPRSRTVLPGVTLSFSVTAEGSSQFNYQWFHDTHPLTGATNASLTISNSTSSDLGSYTVQVSNAAGSTLSDPATLQFPAVAAKSYKDTVLSDSPVSYWRLGESEGDVALDQTGLYPGNYLNSVGLGVPGAIAADTDTAAHFGDVPSTKVDVPFTSDLNTATFTIECWARVTGGSGNYRSPVTSRADLPQRGFIFYATPDNFWEFWTGKGDSSGWTALHGSEVSLNTYAHLVGIYDGTTLYFYVNGNLVASQDAKFAPNDLNVLRIGGGATEGDGNYFFVGDVDEVSVYPVALGEDRVLAHFVAGAPLTTPPKITTQPVAVIALPGKSATFQVTASGGQPLKYQWRLNKQPIQNATGPKLQLTNISDSNLGSYDVVVSNAGGQAVSDAVTLSFPSIPKESYSELVQKDGAAAYWRLDETEDVVAHDIIGGNDGTYLNGVTLGVPGAILRDSDTAANFDSATHQKMDAPWTETQNPPQFTAEVWARVTGNNGNYRSPLTSRADSPQRGFIFYAEPGNTWQFWSGKGDQSGWDSIAGPSVSENGWDYLVATYDGTTKRFYVNGTEVGTSIAAFAVNDTSPLRAGGGATEGSGDFFFQGDVDEVAIYPVALTPEQIIAHYVAGVTKSQVVRIEFTRSNTGMTLTWSAGTLESASSLNGPWTPILNASSPYVVNFDKTAQYYRTSSN